MKRILALALVLLASGNAFALFGGGCGSCRTTTSSCPTTCEERPICYKMVRKECPARQVCEKICHYECPTDTIREDAAR